MRNFIALLWYLLTRFIEVGRKWAGNIVFLAFFIFGLIFMISLLVNAFKPSDFKEKTALVLNLNQAIVEHLDLSPEDLIKQQILDSGRGPHVLRDIVKAIDSAAEDRKIDRIALYLEDFPGAGLVILEEIGKALKRFRESGKEVLVYSPFYDQRRYYLAAHANEIYLDPEGAIIFPGFGRYRRYYRSLLREYGARVHVLRTGDFKTFGEQFYADRPSAASLESEKVLLESLWESYLERIEDALKNAQNVNPPKFRKYSRDFLTLVENSDHKLSHLARDTQLVTALLTENEFRELLIERGTSQKWGESTATTFRQIHWQDYLKEISSPFSLGESGIAVIIAEGAIVDGPGESGQIGGRSMARQIRQARLDDRVKAIVFRVNSGGGSAVASEVIRRELELAREAGKPVVVSMGNMAASGGLWISLASDFIFADPATITGSIGVVGLIPDLSGSLDKLKVSVHGQSTTELGEIFPDGQRKFDPRAERLFDQLINRSYADFLSKVAESRSLSVEEVDSFARGRVWTGLQARELGLVDDLGGIAEAITKASELADIPRDQYFFWRPARTRFQQVLESLFNTQVFRHISFRLPELFNLYHSPLTSFLGEEDHALFGHLMPFIHNLGQGNLLQNRILLYCFCDDIRL